MSHRILVVDDDQVTRMALGALLGGEGYEVVTAGDGRTAIAELEQFSPDLIITDLNMPRLGGLDVIRTIRAHPELSQVPIIVVSGTEDARARIDGFYEGADDVVRKPVELDELLARIDRHLRRHAHEVEQARCSVADELTHLLNRRGLENLFARHSQRCAKEKTSLSLIFVDLNAFKDVNDSFGHTVGDTALCAIADALQNVVRATDRVGRLGGDEFLVLMPDTSEEEARGVVERLRQRMPIELPMRSEPNLSLTFSLGCATWIPGESFSELVARADREMYEDKSRDRRRRGHERGSPS